MVNQFPSRQVDCCKALWLILLMCIGCHSIPNRVPQATLSSNLGNSSAPQSLPSASSVPTPPSGNVSNARNTTADMQIAPVSYQQPELIPELIHVAEEVPTALTLEQVLQMAISGNPAIGVAAARVDALRGKWVQVGLAPNPTLGYVASEVGNDAQEGQQGMYVGQTFVRGNKLNLNRAIVSQEISRAEQELSTIRQRVLTDTRRGFYDVLIAQRKSDLAEELVKVSEKAVKASNSLLQAQEISVVALLQTELVAENTLILARRAQNEREAAWRRLASVLASPDMSPTRLVGDLEAEAMLEWDEQLQRIMAESPEIAAALAELDRANGSLDRAFAQVKTDVNVQLAVQYDTATYYTVAGVQVGLPIPLWDRNQGGIRQAQGEIAAAERNIQRVELGLQERLATAFQRYADARFQVEKYGRDILPKAQRTFDLVTRAYEKAEVGYIDMLTAQRTYFQTRLQSIEAKRELWQSRILIEGLLLDGSLSDDAY